MIEEKIQKLKDMIFISVNTPTKKRGLGAGKASDLKWVEACARQVAHFSKRTYYCCRKSTLPVKTAEVIKSILKAVEVSLIDNSQPKLLMYYLILNSYQKGPP